MTTIGQCLATLEMSLQDLKGCYDLNSEFNKIKKEYYKQALKTHPDKGGDVKTFQEVQASFEILREIYDSCHDTTFLFSSAQKQPVQYVKVFRDVKRRPTPPYAFYAKFKTGKAPIPSYKVESARSGRSACLATGIAKKCDDSNITRHDLRVGSFNVSRCALLIGG